MNIIFLLLLLIIDFAQASVIPTNTVYNLNPLVTALAKRDGDVSGVPCGSLYWSYSTKTVVSTVNGAESTGYVTMSAYRVNACVQETTHDTLTVTSTTDHCEVNVHCTSTSFYTPICGSGSITASCSVLPTPAITSEGSIFYVSETTCYNPPSVTGSFSCHETSSTVDVLGTSSVFTYTNCDIPVFTCPAAQTVSIVTDCLGSSQTAICQMTDTSVIVGVTTAFLTSTSCTAENSLVSFPSNELITTIGDDTTSSAFTITNYNTPKMDCHTFTPSTSTATTFITDCASSSIPATCIIENSYFTVGSHAYTLTSTSCTATATMPGSFVNVPSTIAITQGTLTTTLTISNYVSPSFSCEIPTSSTTIPLTCNELYWSTYESFLTVGTTVTSLTTSVFTHFYCDSPVTSSATSSSTPSLTPPTSTPPSSTPPSSTPPSSTLPSSTSPSPTPPVLSSTTSFSTISSSSILTTFSSQTFPLTNITTQSVSSSLSSIPEIPLSQSSFGSSLLPTTFFPSFVAPTTSTLTPVLTTETVSSVVIISTSCSEANNKPVSEPTTVLTTTEENPTTYFTTECASSSSNTITASLSQTSSLVKKFSTTSTSPISTPPASTPSTITTTLSTLVLPPSTQIPSRILTTSLPTTSSTVEILSSTTTSTTTAASSILLPSSLQTVDAKSFESSTIEPTSSEDIYLTTIITVSLTSTSASSSDSIQPTYSEFTAGTSKNHIPATSFLSLLLIFGAYLF